MNLFHHCCVVNFYRHQSNLDPSKVQTQLSESAKSKVISTRIRVARNLSMFPLNPGGKTIQLYAIAHLNRPPLVISYPNELHVTNLFTIILFMVHSYCQRRILRPRQIPKNKYPEPNGNLCCYLCAV